MAKNVDCIKCGGERTGSHPSYCRPCYREYDRRRFASDPEKTQAQNDAKAARYELKRGHLRNRQLTEYGLAPGDYERILAEQGHRCNICRTDVPGGRGRFHVDHCHVSGNFRSILCANCNVALGLVRDNETTLLAMAAYVARHAPPTSLGAEQ